MAILSSGEYANSRQIMNYSCSGGEFKMIRLEMGEDLGRLLKCQQNYILKMSTGQFYTYLTKGKGVGKVSCEKCLQGG